MSTLRGYNSLDEIIQGTLDPRWELRLRQEFLRKNYLRLRGYYDALRFVQKQLRYDNLPRHRLGMIPSIIKGLLRGFEYAAMYGKEVPPGLRRIYNTYVTKGAQVVAEELAKRILEAAEPDKRPLVESVLRRALLPIPLLG